MLAALSTPPVRSAYWLPLIGQSPLRMEEDTQLAFLCFEPGTALIAAVDHSLSPFTSILPSFP